MDDRAMHFWEETPKKKKKVHRQGSLNNAPKLHGIEQETNAIILQWKQ